MHRHQQRVVSASKALLDTLLTRTVTSEVDAQKAQRPERSLLEADYPTISLAAPEGTLKIGSRSTQWSFTAQGSRTGAE